MADTHQWNVCVRTGDSKFSKQMKKKILSYRIIRIKRIFSGVYWCITWTKSLTNFHKSPGPIFLNSLQTLRMSLSVAYCKTDWPAIDIINKTLFLYLFSTFNAYRLHVTCKWRRKLKNKKVILTVKLIRTVM